jgi:hypothetical protein
MLHTCLLYGVFWCSFCLVLVKLVNYPAQPGVSLVFLLVFPFAVFAASIQVRMRRAHIEKSEVADLESAAEIELKARFIMGTCVCPQTLRFFCCPLIDLLSLIAWRLPTLITCRTDHRGDP